MVVEFRQRPEQADDQDDDRERSLHVALTTQDRMLGTVEGVLSRVQAHLQATERRGFEWRTHVLLADVGRTLNGVTMLRSRLLLRLTDHAQAKLWPDP